MTVLHVIYYIIYIYILQYGYTPLILAVKANNYEAVKVLLQSKADLNLPTKDVSNFTKWLWYRIQASSISVMVRYISNNIVWGYTSNA